jgi:hypothetical protein
VFDSDDERGVQARDHDVSGAVRPLRGVPVARAAVDRTPDHPRQRVRVVPLTGRNFTYQDLGLSGDNQKGQVVGEYTVEVTSPRRDGRPLAANAREESERVGVGHGIHQADVERWARHLRDIVQPQLDELEQLKATMAKKGKSTAVTA